MKQSKITLNPKRIFIYKSSKKNVQFDTDPTSATYTTQGTSGIIFLNK